MSNHSYTVEEIAQVLKVSKLTVYKLINSGKLPAYKVGRQMRVDDADLELYKQKTKRQQDEYALPINPTSTGNKTSAQDEVAIGSIVISGQDVCLDILASYLQKHVQDCRPLRSYAGSLNSLISMYQGEADVVSTHLFDGDTGEYNLPYVRKILTGHRYIIVNLICRWAGFYVKKGNPKNIFTWSDLNRSDISIVNREIGSGSRVLLDEQLRLVGIPAHQVKGYNVEELNHLGVAGAVVRGAADVGVGIEKVAAMVDVDFIPLIKERYDLVIVKSSQNEELIKSLFYIIKSGAFQKELESIGGYDLSKTGQVIYET